MVSLAELAVAAGGVRASGLRETIGMQSVTISFLIQAKFTRLADSNSEGFMVAALGQ